MNHGFKGHLVGGIQTGPRQTGKDDPLTPAGREKAQGFRPLLGQDHQRHLGVPAFFHQSVQGLGVVEDKDLRLAAPKRPKQTEGGLRHRCVKTAEEIT